MKRLVLLSTVLFAACGDDKNSGTVDAGLDPDSSPTPDAAPDATPALTWPTPVEVALSTTGPDQFISAAPGPNGSFYVAGFRATTFDGTRLITVAKLTSAGALDTNFGGGDGFFESSYVFRGGGGEIQLAVQSDGKIVVAGTIADEVAPTDRDIGVFRVDATGVLDSLGFGTLGYSRIDLSAAFDDAGTLTKTDALRALAVGPSDALFIHAISRNDATNDGDFTVARLTAAGALDTAGYGTDGMYHLELNETNGVATVRAMSVLADGSVLAAGYARTETSNATPQPVLYKVAPDGTELDNTFATDGLFHETLLTQQTEIYGFAIDGSNITTAGYGHEVLDAPNVWASLRFNVDDGARSTTFGGATSGVVTVDPSGTLAGTNCRNAVALPGGKTALVGSAGGSAARNAAVAILAQNGQLDTTYEAGYKAFDLGAGEDQFWGGAVSGGKLLLVGWKGYGETQTEAANDNAAVVVIDMQ